MMTLTARHHRSMTLRDYWDALSLAEKRMKTTRSWRRLMLRAAGGFAKAVEITHGEKSGWHPHFHVILLLDAADEDEAVELVEELRSEWLHQLTRVGLDGVSKAAQAHAFDVRGAAGTGSYITKWGAAEELSLQGAKVGRAEGRTPWELLRGSRVADTPRQRARAAELWWEFVQVLRGVHQLRQSPAFRQLAAEHEPDEPSAVEETETEIFDFGRPDFDPTWLYARSKRLLMRETAERVPVEQAHDAVLEVILCEKEDEDLWHHDVPVIEDG